MANRPDFSERITNPLMLTGELTPEEVERVKHEMKLWDYYKRKQWKVKRPTGEPQITINYSRAFVDKGVSFLMGKGFNVQVKSNATDITKPLLDEVWEDNDKELRGIDIAQSGGVQGNAWIKVTLQQYENGTLEKELYPKGRIRFFVLPSYTVFPTWNAHDKDKLNEVKIIYPITVEERRGTKVNRETKWYREVLTDEYIEEYINDDLVERKENPIGVVPIVRIKNLPVADDPLGVSDIEDIVPLQDELNSKATDISDIINYHAAPITIIQGAKVGNLEKGHRKIWGGIPKDGKVYNLELNTDLKAAMDYLDLVKSCMFESGKMPADAFGRESRISNVSGVALHVRNQPLMELTRTKWTTYGEGIRKINFLILRYAEEIGHESLNEQEFYSLKPIERYWSKVEFPNPLPKDELVQMQLIAQRIKLFLMSRKDALMELGETQAKQKLEEILEEAYRIESMLYENEATEDANEINIGGIIPGEDQVTDEEDEE